MKQLRKKIRSDPIFNFTELILSKKKLYLEKTHPKTQKPKNK
jgi:hypothetical protein